MSTTGLLAGSSGSNSLNGALQDVSQFKSLNKVTEIHYKWKGSQLFLKKGFLRIPDHAPILDAYVIKALVDGSHFLNTFVQCLLSSLCKSTLITDKIIWFNTYRKTAASDCMAFCMSRRILAVGSGPSDCLTMTH